MSQISKQNKVTNQSPNQNLMQPAESTQLLETLRQLQPRKQTLVRRTHASAAPSLTAASLALLQAWEQPQQQERPPPLPPPLQFSIHKTINGSTAQQVEIDFSTPQSSEAAAAAGAASSSASSSAVQHTQNNQ
jgi:hypothetical protein